MTQPSIPKHKLWEETLWILKYPVHNSEVSNTSPNQQSRSLIPIHTGRFYVNPALLIDGLVQFKSKIKEQDPQIAFIFRNLNGISDPPYPPEFLKTRPKWILLDKLPDQTQKTMAIWSWFPSFEWILPNVNLVWGRHWVQLIPHLYNLEAILVNERDWVYDDALLAGLQTLCCGAQDSVHIPDMPLHFTLKNRNQPGLEVLGISPRRNNEFRREAACKRYWVLPLFLGHKSHWTVGIFDHGDNILYWKNSMRDTDDPIYQQTMIDYISLSLGYCIDYTVKEITPGFMQPDNSSSQFFLNDQQFYSGMDKEAIAKPHNLLRRMRDIWIAFLRNIFYSRPNTPLQIYYQKKVERNDHFQMSFLNAISRIRDNNESGIKLIHIPASALPQVTTPSSSSRQQNNTPQQRNNTPQQRNNTPQQRNNTPQQRNNTPQQRNNTPQQRNITPRQRTDGSRENPQSLPSSPDTDMASVTSGLSSISVSPIVTIQEVIDQNGQRVQRISRPRLTGTLESPTIHPTWSGWKDYKT
ncbi:hypothetical protein QBC43DRAFT_294661 [Cladorrhinum sp. PSN259]|nr:hypothetical protein QBC43DRAFT_294661 [Cladorrhinum sp. PSN259]